MFFSDIYSSVEQNQREKLSLLSERLDFSFLRGRILDIGCGTCVLESFLEEKGFDLSGFVCIDPDPKMLSQNRSSARPVQASYESFSPECEFDAVVCIDSIHLFKGDPARHLKKNGFLLASIFFNPGNLEEKRRLLLKRLESCEIVQELFIPAKESEFFVLARKK